jgi:hypothetical protein
MYLVESLVLYNNYNMTTGGLGAVMNGATAILMDGQRNVLTTYTWNGNPIQTWFVATLPTVTATQTGTPSNTPTGTGSPSQTPSQTETPSSTLSPGAQPSLTPTTSATASATMSATSTPLSVAPYRARISISGGQCLNFLEVQVGEMRLGRRRSPRDGGTEAAVATWYSRTNCELSSLCAASSLVPPFLCCRCSARRCSCCRRLRWARRLRRPRSTTALAPWAVGERNGAEQSMGKKWRPPSACEPGVR